jgi:argininosuccinate lyase
VTLWGGRFAEEPDAVAWRFTTDVSDRRLLVDDVTGSLAHVAMLAGAGLMSREEEATLTAGLESILAEAEEGSFAFSETDEDVHTAVERRLGEICGDVAGKLHTGRSRNDQVCLDLRLYLRRAAGERITQLHRLVGELADKAEEVGDTVVAAYTHLQQAQAVPLAHHLLAYAWMLLRDAERFADARRRIDVSPLGAGAAGGSSLPLDPAAVADHLGFGGVFANSLDAVASRDFAAEYAFCAAQSMAHLSRLGEELVLWATLEFGWTEYADRHTTGSSALPQKKNPDVAELVRGRAATVTGDVAGLLALQKGLPLAYNRDLQEDKRAAFHADDTLAGALEAMTVMVGAAVFTPPLPSPYVTALDLAEALVGRGTPFREAHAIVGRLVRFVADAGKDWERLTVADLTSVDGRFVPADVACLDPVAAVGRRLTSGGGSMASVRKQLEALRERVAPEG